MAASLAINRLVDGKEYDSDSEEADKTSRMSGSGDSAPLLEELSIAKPKDRFKMVYWIMLLMGLGSLLPWNMFITASSYFTVKFHNKYPNFESYFAVASFIPNVLATFSNIFLQAKISIKIRIITSFIGMLVMFIVTTSLTFVDTSNWVDGFFAFTIISIAILNVLAAINQSSLFGVAGLFPGHYTSAVMGGQGVAGMFASVARIVAIVAGNNAKAGTSEEAKEDTISIIYFISACVVLMGCIVGSVILFRLPFYLFNERNSTSKAKTNGNEGEKTKVPFFLVFRKVLPYGLSVFVTFAITIGIFPGAISMIRSTDNKDCGPKRGCTLDSEFLWTGTLFTPLVCFLMFNVSDYTGRTLSNWCTQPKHWVPLLLSCLLRFIFFPLFALCFIPGTRFDSVFTHDAVPVLFCMLFGIGNGYLASIAMIHSPSRVPIKYSETASVIAGAFLTTGLATGGAISVIFLRIIIKPEYIM